MKALISTIEPVQSGFRVAQVVADSETFSISADLFWIDCGATIEADKYWYDPIDSTIKKVPEIKRPIVTNQPISVGAQTL